MSQHTPWGSLTMFRPADCTLCNAPIAVGDARPDPRPLPVRPHGPAYVHADCRATLFDVLELTPTGGFSRPVQAMPHTDCLDYLRHDEGDPSRLRIVRTGTLPPDMQHAARLESALDDVDEWLRNEYAGRGWVNCQDCKSGRLLATVRQALGLPVWTGEDEEPEPEADPCELRVNVPLF